MDKQGGDDNPCTAVRKNHAPFFFFFFGALVVVVVLQQITFDRELHTYFHKDCVLSFSVSTNNGKL